MPRRKKGWLDLIQTGFVAYYKVSGFETVWFQPCRAETFSSKYLFSKPFPQHILFSRRNGDVDVDLLLSPLVIEKNQKLLSLHQISVSINYILLKSENKPLLPA